MVEFYNGFEEGDFTAWTGTSGAPTVVSTPVHHGGYSEYINAAEYCYYDVAGDTIYARCYVRFETVTTNRMNIIDIFNGSNFISLETKVSGTLKWCMEVNTGSWEAIYSALDAPTTGQWYCVELKYQRNTLNGAEFWINGVSQGTCTGTTENYATSRVLFGGRINSDGSEWIDCAVIDTAYIGCDDDLFTTTTTTTTTTSTTTTSTTTISTTTTYPPCVRDVCLEVNGYIEVTKNWETQGASPYIDDWDTPNKYVRSKTNDTVIDEFTYEDDSVGTPTVVKLALWAMKEVAGDDKFEAWIYDGSSWSKAGEVTPTTSYAKYELDVSVVLDTWIKINAAKLRLKYIEV